MRSVSGKGLLSAMFWTQRSSPKKSFSFNCTGVFDTSGGGIFSLIGVGRALRTDLLGREDVTPSDSDFEGIDLAPRGVRCCASNMDKGDLVGRDPIALSVPNLETDGQEVSRSGRVERLRSLPLDGEVTFVTGGSRAGRTGLPRMMDWGCDASSARDAVALLYEFCPERGGIGSLLGSSKIWKVELLLAWSSVGVVMDLEPSKSAIRFLNAASSMATRELSAIATRKRS